MGCGLGWLRGDLGVDSFCVGWLVCSVGGLWMVWGCCQIADVLVFILSVGLQRVCGVCRFVGFSVGFCLVLCGDCLFGLLSILVLD